MTRPASSAQPLPLCQMAPGAGGRVHAIEGQHEVNHRLRELGFCEAAQVRKISGHATVICEVCGTRLGLSHEVARRILVSPDVSPA